MELTTDELAKVLETIRSASAQAYRDARDAAEKQIAELQAKLEYAENVRVKQYADYQAKCWEAGNTCISFPDWLDGLIRKAERVDDVDAKDAQADTEARNWRNLRDYFGRRGPQCSSDVIRWFEEREEENTSLEQKVAKLKSEVKRHEADNAKAVEWLNAQQQEMARCQKDAELGRLVRAMPVYSELRCQSDDWYARSDFRGGLGITGNTPEEALKSIEVTTETNVP